MNSRRVKTAVALTAAVSTGLLLVQVHRLLAGDREAGSAAADPGSSDLTLATVQHLPAAGPASFARSATLEFLEHTARHDSYVIIRHEAVLALGKLGAASVPVLQSLLTDEHWLVRAEAAAQLGDLGNAAALPALIEVLRSDKDPWVQEQAGRALAGFGSDGVAYLRDHLLASAVAAQRALGMKLLAGMAVDGSTQADLLRLLADDHATVRRAAVQHAPAWRDRAVAEALVPLLHDRDRQVRSGAESALLQLAEFAQPQARALATSVERTERTRGYELLALVGSEDDAQFLNECRTLERTRSMQNAVNRAQRDLRRRLNATADAPAATADPAAAVLAQLPQLENEYLIAVDCDANRLWLVRDRRVLRECTVATGMDRRVAGYFFRTPRGEFSVLSKKRDPLWYRPAWAWAERGQAVPTGPERWRGIPGVMGKFMLDLGHGYAIHGTNDEASLGRKATHGCIRVGSTDLEAIFHLADVGTRVYIF